MVVLHKDLRTLAEVSHPATSANDVIAGFPVTQTANSFQSLVVTGVTKIRDAVGNESKRVY